MWVVLPVKHLKNSKIRLKDVLTGEQRSRFSYLLIMDTLQTLCSSVYVQGVTMISSDQSLSRLAKQYRIEFIKTEKDSGYSIDAMDAIISLSENSVDKIAIIPTDLPQLSHYDLELLNNAHQQGITLCAAEKDGGTNALVFTPPLAIPLLFGLDSFNKHQHAVRTKGLKLNIVQAPGMQRDIDKEQDLNWLIKHTQGGKAWEYIKDLFVTAV